METINSRHKSPPPGSAFYYSPPQHFQFVPAGSFPPPFYTHPHFPRVGASTLRPSRSHTVPSRLSTGQPRAVPCPSCSPTSPRRTRATTYTTFHPTGSTSDIRPWEDMANAYTWLFEEEIAEMARKNEETVRWIWEQRERDAREQMFFTKVTIGTESSRHGLGRGQSFLDEFLYESEEEAMKKSARYWQKEMERRVQEEIRRLAGKRKDGEKHRRSREKHQAKDRESHDSGEKKTKVRREDAEKKAWEGYEGAWNRISNSSDLAKEFTFTDIPWPMVKQPSTVDDITPARLTMFLFSTAHSEGRSRKDRVRSALRRWHPDRFGRILQRACDGDKARIEEGVGIVVRCLNNLLEREG